MGKVSVKSGGKEEKSAALGMAKMSRVLKKKTSKKSYSLVPSPEIKKMGAAKVKTEKIKGKSFLQNSPSLMQSPEKKKQLVATKIKTEKKKAKSLQAMADSQVPSQEMKKLSAVKVKTEKKREKSLQATTDSKVLSHEKKKLSAVKIKTEKIEAKSLQATTDSQVPSREMKKLSAVKVKTEKKREKSHIVKKEAQNMKSPEVEITFKRKSEQAKLAKKSVKKSKTESSSKLNRFDEMKKIHNTLKEKKEKTIKQREEDKEDKKGEEDKESDESADEDDEACRSYAQDFGMAETNEVLEANDSDVEEASKQEKREKKQKKKKQKEAWVNRNHPDEVARTVFVSNVSLSTTGKKMLAFMKPYGKVLNVRFRNLPLNRNTKLKLQQLARKKEFRKDASSMCAFVKFSAPEQAEAALAANGKVLDDHHVFVEPASQKTSEAKRDVLSSGQQIVVGNLPYAAETEPLYKMFEGCGNIVNICIPQDKNKRCIGVAFVTFADKEAAAAALALTGLQLFGRSLRVSLSVRKPKPRPAAPKVAAAKRSPASKVPRSNKEQLRKKAIAKKLAATPAK